MSFSLRVALFNRNTPFARLERHAPFARLERHAPFARLGRRALLSLAAGALALSLGTPSFAAQPLKLGVMAGAEEQIAEVVQKVAASKGLAVELIPFTDYALPNEALNAGELDANAFQHKPYLDSQIAARGYKIVPIGFTIVEPIGLYTKSVKSVADLKEGARIGIPNDPSNGDRALRLLASAGLLTLRDTKGSAASPLDITSNPKNLKILELEAAQLPRALGDLDAAVINTGYAVDAGLHPATDAIAQEPRVGNPYGNFIAARAGDVDRADLKLLVASYQSPEVQAFIETHFKGAILPAW
ncbi:MetQ/NlpA family ABC transporter substrate-binding protein [Pararhodospirillum oryzae]|uniref:Lipoprotein n=1 Tax=Pararhodospirillum oryzae TaxID=478448 RepID=A0A512H3W7_9PROT|nr:MetQ/NlpA family ABC transporter substrate-binding protein [Pararhodospirillum oryzae]GEO80162.1 metal ABC transporter substrate-binding protein [Pararhodospirillum oryzae]